MTADPTLARMAWTEAQQAAYAEAAASCTCEALCTCGWNNPASLAMIRIELMGEVKE
jgi:hypothetical protein